MTDDIYITCARRGFFEFILSMYHQLSSFPPLSARYAIIKFYLLTSHVSLLLTAMASLSTPPSFLSSSSSSSFVSSSTPSPLSLLSSSSISSSSASSSSSSSSYTSLSPTLSSSPSFSSYYHFSFCPASSCLVSVSLHLPATRMCVRLHPSACRYLQIILTRLHFLSLSCASLTSSSRTLMSNKRGCGRSGNTARESGRE